LSDLFAKCFQNGATTVQSVSRANRYAALSILSFPVSFLYFSSVHEAVAATLYVLLATYNLIYIRFPLVQLNFSENAVYLSIRLLATSAGLLWLLLLDAPIITFFYWIISAEAVYLLRTHRFAYQAMHSPQSPVCLNTSGLAFMTSSYALAGIFQRGDLLIVSFLFTEEFPIYFMIVSVANVFVNPLVSLFTVTTYNFLIHYAPKLTPVRTTMTIATVAGVAIALAGITLYLAPLVATIVYPQLKNTSAPQIAAIVVASAFTFAALRAFALKYATAMQFFTAHAIAIAVLIGWLSSLSFSQFIVVFHSLRTLVYPTFLAYVTRRL
jgi:hypothetical protein